MEAARVPREADVAPAPATTEPTGGRLAGWTPADPGPLGLAAFAGTTFMLSMINAGLVGNATLVGGALLPVVAGLARADVGIAQVGAALRALRTGDPTGAAAFATLRECQ